MEKQVSIKTVAFGKGFIFAAVVNFIILLIKHYSPAFHSGMAAATGHHWITHGLLVILTFVIVGFIYLKKGIACGTNEPSIAEKKGLKTLEVAACSSKGEDCSGSCLSKHITVTTIIFALAITISYLFWF